MTTICRRKPTMAIFARFIFSLILINHHQVKSEPTDHEKELLLSFITQVKHHPLVDWKLSVPACDWYGVTCDPTMNYVRTLSLPGKSLMGNIPENTIGKLPYLEFLSLHDNGLTGNIPSDFSNLKYLKQFVLHNNKFTGKIPNINSEFLKQGTFDVSNNDLSGQIPSSLSKFESKVFSRNPHLCGIPLPVCKETTSPEPDAPIEATVEKKPRNKLSTGAIVGIAVGSPLLILVLLSCLRKERNNNQAKTVPPVAVGCSKKEDINKFVFFDGGVFSFGLQDLLWASAEVLGKGSVGTTYKTLLKDGTTVVVKRLKDVLVSKKEFDLQMRVLGNMKNENVASLRGFYYSEDEKLLVYDYLPAGSLYDLLHGGKGSSRTPLDWDHRMRIATSAARGISYLHVVGNIVHGNIKSSNILLGQETNKDTVLVSDYGLNTLFGIWSSVNHSPTFKSDVYSFGVLLLEILTGKAPNQASLGEEGIDLPKWVQSVERTTEVFDVELTRVRNNEQEMVRVLKIAMKCVSIEQDQRPTMQEVVRMMENMYRVEMVEIIAE